MGRHCWITQGELFILIFVDARVRERIGRKEAEAMTDGGSCVFFLKRSARSGVAQKMRTYQWDREVLKEVKGCVASQEESGSAAP